VNVGTKSLLFGAHWPPHVLMVTAAWRWLYGAWPTLRELGAICLHDIGYAGCLEMDGPDGTGHPLLGAIVADFLLGEDMGDLIRGHSKGYAEAAGVPLSKLYGPDKLSHACEPTWLYVWRTRLTGEIRQYRAVSHGCAPRNDDPAVSDYEWFRVIRMRMARGGIDHAIGLTAPNGLGEHRGR
jgi:hypothetical protein